MNRFLDPAAPGITRLSLASTPQSVRAALEHLFSRPPLAHWPEEARGTAEIVMAEVLNNIVEHAYGADGGVIEMSLCREEGGIQCHIADTGRPFPFGTPPEGILPDLSEDLPEGGFGWALIRAYAENLRYERCEGWNHIQFHISAGLPEI
ncbi:MAG: ATP-binding protein [Pseudorhodobacter sp.]